MSKDISSIYTRYQNNNTGRKGYFLWRETKNTVISPKDYGMFLQSRRKKRK